MALFASSNRIVPMLLALTVLLVFVCALENWALIHQGELSGFVFGFFHIGDAWLPGTMVLIGNATELDFYDGVKVDGYVKSRFHSFVTSPVGGTIDKVMIGVGDVVEKDRSELFSVNSRRARHDVELCRANLVTAYAMLEENLRILKKTESVLADTLNDLEWLRSFHEEREVGDEELDAAEAAVKEMTRQKHCDEEVVRLCREKVDQAMTEMMHAMSRLQRTVVTSPVDGVITASFAEVGCDMPRPGRPLLRIDDIRQLKVVVDCPRDYYGLVRENETIMEVALEDKPLGELLVTYKCPELLFFSDTFEVHAEVESDGKTIYPGMTCSVKLRIAKTRGLGVHKKAIQKCNDRHYVFIPEGDGTKMLEVTPGLQSDEWVQLVDSPLQAGDRVVIDTHKTSGNAVKNGTAV